LGSQMISLRLSTAVNSTLFSSSTIKRHGFGAIIVSA
jgi:hypothetical protein